MFSKSAGELFLIPTPISDLTSNFINDEIKSTVDGLKLFFVENVKVARRFLKAIDKEFDIDQCLFIEIGKRADKEEIDKVFEKIWLGENAGVMSDAGCPGIGDPGSEVVKMAHESGVKVRPLIGANSFMLALMASGFNGQNFRFHGYLPIDKNIRVKALKNMLKDLNARNETQIFMDTPYRNQALLDVLLKTVDPSVFLCIALDIKGEKEYIETARISDWRKMKYKIPKSPAVFLLGSHH